MKSEYDYVICGSGCAGLSLLHSMMREPFFNNKQILVIDQSEKNTNDRTWCFWEQEAGTFEAIVHHRWKQIDFCSDYFSARFDIVPYEYKMILAIDFYNYVLGEAKQRSNIDFIYGNVQSLTTERSNATVTINDLQIAASYIFNSIVFDKKIFAPSFAEGYHFLLQHFKGWLIQVSSKLFDPYVATFMDFRVSQKHGTTFVYLLPVAEERALVEYTLFSKKILPQTEYDAALKQYLSSFARIDEFDILHEEYGVIPMTNFPFSKGEGRIVHVGTAGGQTKASSGFTFRSIQKHTARIIDALINDLDPHIKDSFAARRFNLYDSTLLNVLSNNKMGGDKIFADLFKNNPPQRVLRFLDNETNFGEELKIMNSVSAGIFFPATLAEMFK